MGLAVWAGVRGFSGLAARPRDAGGRPLASAAKTLSNGGVGLTHEKPLPLAAFDGLRSSSRVLLLLALNPIFVLPAHSFGLARCTFASALHGRSNDLKPQEPASKGGFSCAKSRLARSFARAPGGPCDHAVGRSLRGGFQMDRSWQGALFNALWKRLCRRFPHGVRLHSARTREWAVRA